MYQQQRDCIGTFGTRVQKEYVEVFNRSGILGVFVDVVLHGIPVEIVCPGIVKVLRPFVGRAYFLSGMVTKDEILGHDVP